MTSPPRIPLTSPLSTSYLSTNPRPATISGSAYYPLLPQPTRPSIDFPADYGMVGGSQPRFQSPARVSPIRLDGRSRSPEPLYSPRTSPSRFPPSPQRIITPSPPREEVRFSPYSSDRRPNLSTRRREDQLTIQVIHRNLSDKDIKKFLKIILKNLLGFGEFALMKIHDDLYRVYFDNAADAAMVFDVLEENDNAFGLELHIRY